MKGGCIVVSMIAMQKGLEHCKKRSVDVLLVVKEVMGQIVADVAENTTTEYCSCGEPIVEEDRLG